MSRYFSLELQNDLSVAMICLWWIRHHELFGAPQVPGKSHSTAQPKEGTTAPSLYLNIANFQSYRTLIPRTAPFGATTVVWAPYTPVVTAGVVMTAPGVGCTTIGAPRTATGAPRTATALASAGIADRDTIASNVSTNATFDLAI